MQSIAKDMAEFREQLRKGTIRRAYRALLTYMMGLRTHFKSKHPDLGVSGLYHGTLDMTYFALFPPALKERDLKVAIVFNYQLFRFEAWLAGRNRQVNREHWTLFRDSEWPAYRVNTPGKGVDAIVECDLVEDLDFSDTDAMTARIEKATGAFIDDMESFLSSSRQVR